jgi:hypothetical protein
LLICLYAFLEVMNPMNPSCKLVILSAYEWRQLVSLSDVELCIPQTCALVIWPSGNSDQRFTDIRLCGQNGDQWWFAEVGIE